MFVIPDKCLSFRTPVEGVWVSAGTDAERSQVAGRWVRPTPEGQPLGEAGEPGWSGEGVLPVPVGAVLRRRGGRSPLPPGGWVQAIPQLLPNFQVGARND
jgi:hypothetical protein